MLERLIKTMEIRALADVSARIALAETSMQLAAVAQAPPAVIRRLARHDEIMVAGPVLTEFARLRAEDLVEIAQTKSEPHLLAISGRWWLTESSPTRCWPAITRRSAAGSSKSRRARFRERICHRRGPGQSDPELAVETGIRVDLPFELRRQLLRNATEAVRARLLSRAPPDIFEEIRSAIAAVSTENRSQKMPVVRRLLTCRTPASAAQLKAKAS